MFCFVFAAPALGDSGAEQSTEIEYYPGKKVILKFAQYLHYLIRISGISKSNINHIRVC